MNKRKTSQINSFYKKSIAERRAILTEATDLSEADNKLLASAKSLSLEQANHMIENVVSIFNLPLGIATNFLINKKDYLIPMVIEEPSVVAACSFAAKMFRRGEGFTTSSDSPIMIGQIQILDLADIQEAINKLEANKTKLLTEVDNISGSIVKRGGGARDIEFRVLENDVIGNMLVLHLLMDTQDAMGANAINTALEHIAPTVIEISGGRVNLRILSNLSDKRKAKAEGIIPAKAFHDDKQKAEEIINAIVEASIFAEIDPYRATTHNKGIMNGIDAVVIATGNDWRAIEAGAHAYAARSGSYSSLTKWRKTESGDLHGEIELPLAVGIVGGATKVHPMAQVALKILGVESAMELAEVMAAVGLAQNFAAIRALATDGIQKGHMRMHSRQLAVAAGATPENVTTIAQQLVEEKNIRLERAKQLVNEMQGEE